MKHWQQECSANILEDYIIPPKINLSFQAISQ